MLLHFHATTKPSMSSLVKSQMTIAELKTNSKYQITIFKTNSLEIDFLVIGNYL